MRRYVKLKRRRVSKPNSIVWCVCVMRLVSLKTSTLASAVPIYTLWLHWNRKQTKLLSAIGKFSAVNGLTLTSIWSIQMYIKWIAYSWKRSSRIGHRASISRAVITYTKYWSESIKFIRSNLPNRCHNVVQHSKFGTHSCIFRPLSAPFFYIIYLDEIKF